MDNRRTGAFDAAALELRAQLQNMQTVFSVLPTASAELSAGNANTEFGGRTASERPGWRMASRNQLPSKGGIRDREENNAELVKALGRVMHLARPDVGHRQSNGESNPRAHSHSKLVQDIKDRAAQVFSRAQQVLETEQRRSWRRRHAQFASISGALDSGGSEKLEGASKSAVQAAKEPALPTLRESLDESNAVEKPEWTSEQQKRGREGRFLIHEVQILDSEGNDLELDHPELKSLIQKTMKISNRPGFAFNVKEVHEDIDRLGRLGLFENVVPYTKDTRDGVVLQLHIAPHPVVRKVVVKGSDVLPTSLIQKETKPLINKVLNMNELYEVIDRFKTWYIDKKFFAAVKPETLDPDGTLTLTAHEPRLRRIDVKVQSGDNPDKVGGYTKMSTIQRNLILKEGQLMNGETLRENKQLLHSMGIFADVNIIPTEVFDGARVAQEATVYLVEKAAASKPFSVLNNFSGGVSLSVLNHGDVLSGLSFSSAWSHSNLFGEGKRLRLEGEKGAGIFKCELDFLDPWLPGDNKRTGRRVQIRNLKTVDHIHCPKPEDMAGDPGRTEGSPAIAKRLACIEYSRPLRPEWLGRAGVQYQSATLKDDVGETKLVDMYGSPLTFSGKPRDDALVVYGNLSWNTQLFLSMKQGLPIAPNWLCFNEMTANWKKGLVVNDYLELQARLQAGTVVGDLAPYDAFELGGTGSVRGWQDGELGTSKSHVSGSLEAIIPVKPNLLEGVLFVDAATDFDSGKLVLGDPAGVRGRPGKGYGFGGGVRVMSPIGPIRLEYGLNDKFQGRYHFGLG